MHRTEPSRLQSLALQLADKLANLVDNNERILKISQGRLVYKAPWAPSGFRDR